VKILKDLHPLTGGGTYVFPGLRPGRPISDGTINKALRTMGYDTRTESLVRECCAVGAYLVRFPQK
jgi:hypothetical protein